MNGDTFEGAARDLGGKAKETLGEAAGSESLKGEGMCDQMMGDAQKAYGKLREFTKENPAAMTALAGVFGLAVIGSIRKRS